VQLGMCVQEAQDMTASEDSLQPPIGDNRQLVNVFTAHHRKGFERRGFRRDCAELTQWWHGTLHTRLRPALAVDAVTSLGVDQPNDLVVSDNDVLCDDRCATDIHRQSPAGSTGLPPWESHGPSCQRRG